MNINEPANSTCETNSTTHQKSRLDSSSIQNNNGWYFFLSYILNSYKY